MIPSMPCINCQNQVFSKDLKFGMGSGVLHYYLFNWRMTQNPLQTSDVGLILL